VTAPLKTGPRRLKVRNRRNSECNFDLDALDWSSWFTDTSFGEFYLHIYDLAHDSVQRVRCRKTPRPRLEMANGELYWLVDQT